MPRVVTAPFAGAGAAAGSNAVREAVDHAVAELATEPGLVLVFPAASLESSVVVEQAADGAGGAPVVGMTSNGEIGQGGPSEDGCSALALDSSLDFGIGLATGASHDPRAAGRAATAAAFARLPDCVGHQLLLLFIDPRSGDQAQVIAGAYEITGGHVPFAGGAAGGRDGVQLAHGLAHRDSVVAVAVLSPRPIGVGMAHGCRPRTVPSIVTRAEGRTILQLDGRPADQVYLEKLARLDEVLSDDQFETLAVMHPLAQPELGGDVRLRHVMGRTLDGGLACATPVPVNAAVGFTEQSADAIVYSAGEAVIRALAPLDGSPPQAALVFDCAGRKRALNGDLEREVAAIVDAFDCPLPLAGVYTHGEIGRIRGAKGDRNHALVVVAFA
jgi:hypothetical protein